MQKDKTKKKEIMELIKNLRNNLREKTWQKEKEFIRKNNEFRKKIVELDSKLENLEPKKKRIEHFEKILQKNQTL